jgi:predicted RND superfamily exporter protein
MALDMGEPAFVRKLEHYVFDFRVPVLVVFLLATLAFGWFAVTGLKIDTRFTKQLPLSHEYMQTYTQHQEEFGGANRVLIALIAKDGPADGKMFTAEFLSALKLATDEVFFIPGVDRARVQSLWTPNTRYTEVVEGGIEAGDVIPSGFQATPEGLAQVRENIRKAGVVGRLVANDFSGAIVSAQLLEQDPETGKPVDLIAIGQALENVRAKIQAGDAAAGVPPGAVEVHIIGFAKVMSDIKAGAMAVAIFAIATVLLTLLCVYLYIQSWRIAIVPVFCSIVAVIWMLGLLVILGYGVDPLGILVPFIIFAIGVSHGVQKISAVGDAALEGANSEEAARRTFRQLFIPAIVALLADLVGFVTILAIPVQVIREMAITASLGIGVVILTDLILLPILVSYAKFDQKYSARIRLRAFQFEAKVAPVWEGISKIATKPAATYAILIAIVLALAGFWKGRETPIGDTTAGVPELRPNSVYNRDTDAITSKFSIGTDIINVIVETPPNGCVNYEVMRRIDEFAWHMANVEGVRDVISLPGVSKVVSAGWSEGNLKWRNLPRNEQALVQAQGYIDTSTGLLNKDCSVMPVMIFLADHRAETIERVVAAVKDFRSVNAASDSKFRLATGNVGVMAAQNEEVRAKELPILAYLFAAIAVMCLVTFRSVMGTLVVMIPLALVSILVYAVMAVVGIGLKISTLPMVALGAGIGVDYGIYLFSRMQGYLRKGVPVQESYVRTLRVTGTSIVVTGITLAVGVATWVFSPLKFQADIGLMLTFMFLVNMLAAILLIPALAAWMVKPSPVPPAPPTPAPT